jgi:hypothetical protein
MNYSNYLFLVFGPKNNLFAKANKKIIKNNIFGGFGSNKQIILLYKIG